MAIEWTVVKAEDAEAAVNLIASREPFRGKVKRIVPLLRHLVTMALNGEALEAFSNDTLGSKFYGRRRRSFDGDDSHARTYVKTLRDALKVYAEGAGVGDAVRVLLSRDDPGQNVPVIEYNPAFGGPLDDKAIGALAMVSGLSDAGLLPVGAGEGEWRRTVAELEDALTRHPNHPVSKRRWP